MPCSHYPAPAPMGQVFLQVRVILIFNQWAGCKVRLGHSFCNIFRVSTKITYDPLAILNMPSCWHCQCRRFQPDASQPHGAAKQRTISFNPIMGLSSAVFCISFAKSRKTGNGHVTKQNSISHFLGDLGSTIMGILSPASPLPNSTNHGLQDICHRSPSNHPRSIPIHPDFLPRIPPQFALLVVMPLPCNDFGAG